MCDNDKTIRLFKYIEELSKSRDNIITDVDKYPWKWFLKDVPDDKRHIKLFFRDLDEENSDTYVSDDMTLLEVIKPKLEGCPVLPAILNNWIEDGWENCYYSPVIKQIVETGGETETFGESQQRKNTYENWRKKWEEWAEKRKLEEKTLKLFKELYQAHTDLDRESETLELVLGNGLIIDAQNPEINHPILIKRVDIDFNANKNIIKIVDTDNDPNLYLQLLQ